ncbi:MAG: hypothetical protein AB7V55_08220, partial [Oscillospiraceae bacterium]
VRETYLRDTVYLRIEYTFGCEEDRARSFYSSNGRSWKRLGETLRMRCTLSHFAGYRTALFSYATAMTGGYADFSHLNVQLDPAVPTRVDIHKHYAYPGQKAQ